MVSKVNKNEEKEQSSANKNENTNITTGQRKTRSVTFEDSVEAICTELSVNNAHEPHQPEAIDGLNGVVIEIPAGEETEVRVRVDATATEDNTAEQLVRENEVLSDDNAEVEEERIATDIDMHQAQGEVEESTDGEEVDQKNSSSETSGSSTDDNNIDPDGTVSVKRGPGRPRKNKKKSSDDGDSDRKALLRTGVKVRFKAGDNEAWTSATLGRRGGKKNGVHKHCWNTTDSSGEKKYVNFDKDVDEWELLHDTANQEVTETYLTQSYVNKASEETQIAKQKELDSWRNNEVYTEVENTGQEYLTGKWVIKPKIIDGKHSVKARFVLRGFEEEKEFRTDSPMCMRSSVRLQLAIHSSCGWNLESIDFKTAFLQGKPIEREILMRPPQEENTNKLWKLKKTVYGLCDAPRQWYLRLKSIICELGCRMSKLDSSLFMQHDGNIIVGMIVVFVDDVLWGGTSKFKKEVIAKLKESLQVGSEQSSAFRYVGIHMKQESDHSIRIDQETYVDSMKLIEMSKERLEQKNDLLKKHETAQLRSTMGQVNWVHSITRPDIGFAAGQVNMSKNKATIADMIAANKLVRHIKDTQSSVLFPKLNLKKSFLKVYADASLGNLIGGGSQGGHIIFLTDGVRSCPLVWRSCKVRRVVKSTLAAETLAMLDGLEAAYMLSKLCAEVIYGVEGGVERNLPVVGVTDNRNLVDSAYSSKLLEDRRLLIEMAAIREMINRNEAELMWVKSDDQVSDVLTKMGVSGSKVREVISNGHF